VFAWVKSQGFHRRGCRQASVPVPVPLPLALLRPLPLVGVDALSDLAAIDATLDRGPRHPHRA
jgi:hypothetical protein